MTVALYVPGDRPDRFGKAVATGADVVILDLEDAVPDAHKKQARRAVVSWLAGRGPEGVQVRVTAGSEEDLAALEPFAVALRLPKVRCASDVERVAQRLDRPVHALVEDAAGLTHLDEIAAHPAVVTVALGEADLAADLGSSSPALMEHARIRLVVACRAAGLPGPLMSVYPAIGDLEGLEEDCRTGAALGFTGRAAVHPVQLAPIRRAFRPGEELVRWALEVLDALEDAAVARLGDGQMVDEAMARRARSILERDRLG